MAAVVRLKRRSDEEPIEALVLACKRKRTEDDLATIAEENPFTTILKFAGTVKNQDEDVALHISKNFKKESLRHTPDVTRKLRKETKQLSQENRFKVVNCFRALKEADVSECANGGDHADSADGEKKALTIVDIVSHTDDEKDSSATPSQPQAKLEAEDSSEADAGFVYDLYYTSVAGSNGLVNLDDLSVHPLHQTDWMYRNPEESGEDSPEPEDDDDDSNDENNWRNDYPDSDHSIDEDDMRMAMQGMNLGDGEDLSSDDADEDFVYGVRVDPQDVMLYGEGYADYKARMLRELEGESEDEAYHQEDSDDEDPAQRFV